MASVETPVRTKLRRLGRWLASAAATGILVYLVWRANPRALAEQLAGATWWPLLLALGLNFAQVWLKAYRLRVLLAPVRPLPMGACFRYTLIGYAGNNVLPMRGGEVVRLALLRQREAVPVGAFVGAFSAERLLDGASVIAVAAALPLVAPLPPVARASLLALVVVVALGAGAVALIARRFRTAPADAGRARRFLADLAAGGRALWQPARLAGGLGASLAAMLLEALIVVLVLRGLGLPLHAAAAPLVILFVNLALVAPNAPANLGAFEAGAVLALTLCGVGDTAATAFALAYHAAHLVPLTVAGAVAYATLPERTVDAVPLVPVPVRVADADR